MTVTLLKHMNNISAIGLAFGLILSGVLNAQDRVQPGTLYYEGEDIHGPIVGVETKIPIGWSGMIPHDSEIFFLIPNGGEDAQLFVRAYQRTIEEVKEGWMKGLELQPGLTIRSDGNITDRGDWITSNVVVEGDEQRKGGYQGYLEARCGDYGYCITLFLVCAPADFKRFQKDVQKFADNITLVEPSLADIFADFDWKEFLQYKYGVTYESYQGYKKENHVWICGDGTFRTQLNRKGKLARSERGDYSGKNRGTWTAEGIGAEGKLTLSFSKKNLEPVQVDLFIEENKIYMNGERYFLMDNKDCK